MYFDTIFVEDFGMKNFVGGQVFYFNESTFHTVFQCHTLHGYINTIARGKNINDFTFSYQGYFAKWFQRIGELVLMLVASW